MAFATKQEADARPARVFAAGPDPDQIAPLAESLQFLCIERIEAQGQQVPFPDGPGGGHTPQLLQQLGQGAGTGQPLVGVQVLPAGHKVGVGIDRHRLDLFAQQGQGLAVDAFQVAAVAVFEIRRPAGFRLGRGCDLPGYHLPIFDQRGQGGLQPVCFPRVASQEPGLGQRTVGAQDTAQDGSPRLVLALSSDRVLAQAEGGTVGGSLLGQDVPPARSKTQSGQSPRASQGLHPGSTLAITALSGFFEREIAQGQKDRRQLLGGARPGAVRPVLQAVVHVAHRFGAQQLGQRGLVQELGEQLAAHHERSHLPLGLGLVPLVHILADKVIEQAGRHRAGCDGLGGDELDLTAVDAMQNLFQVGQVQYVAQTIAVGLEDDGKVLESLGHGQQVLGPQPLEPEGGALLGAFGRGQQQGAGGIHPELGTKYG